jgi:hypothetical protein
MNMGRATVAIVSVLGLALLGGCEHHRYRFDDPPCLPAPPPHMPTAPLPEGSQPPPPPHHDEAGPGDERPTHQERSCPPHFEHR